MATVTRCSPDRLNPDVFQLFLSILSRAQALTPIARSYFDFLFRRHLCPASRLAQKKEQKTPKNHIKPDCIRWLRDPRHTGPRFLLQLMVNQ